MFDWETPAPVPVNQGLLVRASFDASIGFLELAETNDLFRIYGFIGQFRKISKILRKAGFA